MTFRAAAVFLVAILVGGCSSPCVLLTPPSGPPYSIRVDCGPIPAEVSECLAMVSAAARIIPASPGSRAVITNGATLNMRMVTLIAANGNAQAVDIVVNPLGGYVGVNPRSSPWPGESW